MMNAHDAGTLQQFDLLPPSFHHQIRLRQLRCSWILTVLILVAAMCGVTAATILRERRDRMTRERIAAAAAPLIELRRNVFELQDEIQQQEQACQLVEAARPDDSLLQTLAAVAAASQNGTREIVVDNLHLRLPVEYPATAPEMPEWARPRLTVSARVIHDSIEPWLDRLNHFDRIDGAVLAGNLVADETLADKEEFRLHLESYPVKVTATPVATRVLP